MRLLDTTTLKHHEFFGTNIPPYAILSHRWGNSEVTFQDLENEKYVEMGVEMAGWTKIKRCCAQAAKDGYKYAWVDSCCIDKSSSAELTEAINSMFSWYRDAQVCYAYISDVYIAGEGISTLMPSFRQSQWFTRGWTLQELLAPEKVTFFEHDWVKFGTKDSLAQIIKEVTGIEHLFDFERASSAQKMSWASKRKTLRTEDQAYCLLGLFGINMPLLYGEGEKAFLRLQTEIIRTSDDESIFAWTDDLRTSGLLARSPSAFRNSGDIVLCPNRRTSPYSMTNKGLQIALALNNTEDSPSMVWESRFQAPLYCIRRGENQPIALHFQNVYNEPHTYVRLWCRRFVPPDMRIPVQGWKPQQTVFVPQETRRFVNHQPTTVMIHGDEIASQLANPKKVLKYFYPGLFDSGYFHSTVMTAGLLDGGCSSFENLKTSLEERHGWERTFTAQLLQLYTGVALVEYHAFSVCFGLEIHNSRERRPAVALLISGDSGLSPHKLMELRLKEPIKELVHERSKEILTSTNKSVVFVSACVSEVPYILKSNYPNSYLLKVTVTEKISKE